MQGDGTSFAWDACERSLDDLAALGHPGPRALHFDAETGCFRSPAGELEVRPPRVLPPPEPGMDAETWLEALPEHLGIHVLVLLRAGAFAAGLWEDGQLLRHKCAKKYVTRGHGKAQPQHLERRGKSRYGSRLRLQNARALLSDLHSLCGGWCEEIAETRGEPPEFLFLGAPVRLRATWLQKPLQVLPLERIVPLGFEYGEPGFSELCTAYAKLCQGHVWHSE